MSDMTEKPASVRFTVEQVGGYTGHPAIPFLKFADGMVNLHIVDAMHFEGNQVVVYYSGRRGQVVKRFKPLHLGGMTPPEIAVRGAVEIKSGYKHEPTPESTGVR